MTSRERRKYLREEMAKGDYSQACFTRDGRLEALRAAVFTEQSGMDLNKIVFCPFCLTDNKLQRFLVSTKKGISNSRAHCPNCDEGMLLFSLLHDWTPETYAKWVFEYSRSGFWKKVNFEAWKRRLFERGWSEAFWEIYRQLKADNPSESYEDMMNRKGQEAAQQWQQEESGQDA